VRRNPQDGIRDFLTLSALGYMGSYLTACLASPVLLGRIGEPSKRIMALGVVTAVILGVLLVTAFGTGVGHGRVLGVVYVASMVVVTALVLFVSRRSPRLLAGVGVFDATTSADILTTATLR